ncbi:coiled-coil domain-containing protein 174 [Anticarsia gemmatalis]|uniref:coiled-coil domain-containing protein 174 n=1 Tax=Anticarsia gemmatalis TaxID=129554 RepID=UPI003F761BCE
MNDQGSKKILFNKSTLFSLKAELLRKQEEVNEKKQLPKHKVENFKPPTAVKAKAEKDVGKEYKKTFKDSLKAVDTEELEACRKSKAALEKKAELYEHLSDKAGSSQLAGNFLVDFDTKKKQEQPKPVEVVPPTLEDIVEQAQVDDSEWIEYTDCLGRTRKCHKSDLELFVKRDKDLMKIMSNDSSNTEDDKPEEPVEPVKEKPLLVQTTNDYLQSLREKWEQKEQELLAKDKDIHYQDLLFDEARIHGVGYYSFSTDETERKKQMDELIKQREETLKAQKDAEQVRKKRDEMMAARVAAARARQRARAGLPPEEPQQENQKDFTTCLMEFLTQQKNEADAKATEEERKLKEEKEKERQKLREAYVREWDIGKEGIEGKQNKFREMSQEEYVEVQRSKRINEFAPPQTSTSTNAHAFDDRGRMVNSDGTHARTHSRSNARTSPPTDTGDRNNTAPKTWADVRPRMKTPPPPDIGDLTDISQKGLYFSSNKKKENVVKYKNFVKAQEPTPIVNEVDDVDEEIRNTESNNEIAPPPTYDYYGPVAKKTKFQKPFQSDIREAYAQGAKSLETKSSERKLPQHYDFTFD